VNEGKACMNDYRPTEKEKANPDSYWGKTTACINQIIVQQIPKKD
jgi:hypothetical protein